MIIVPDSFFLIYMYLYLLFLYNLLYLNVYIFIFIIYFVLGFFWEIYEKKKNIFPEIKIVN